MSNDLETLLDALDGAQVPYAVCGGLALALHGHPRATRDIDLLVPADALPDALTAAAVFAGMSQATRVLLGTRQRQPREVHRVARRVANGDMLRLDLVVVNGDLQEVWDSRITISNGTRTLTVVSRAGLATMKRLAGRTRDLVDVATLEAP